MKKLLFLIAAAVMMCGGCSEEYDDAPLQNRVGDLENRVAKLEELCRQMNTNITSLQSIIGALQECDYITACTPLMENGTQVGYTLTFANSGPIVIYHGQNGKDGANGSDGKDGKDGTNGTDGKDGKDGKDGHSPVIGAKTDTDGVIYWTIDGKWLLDENGHKIPVQGRGESGSDGKDAIAPQLKIEGGYWYISYDGGTTWTKLGKATGEDGKDGKDGQDGKDGTGGDSFFQNVSKDDNYVYLTLSTGEQIIVPICHPLSIAFDKTDNIHVQANQTYSIGYTLTGADDHTVVKTLAQDGFLAAVKKINNTSGTIEITSPATILPSEVLVFVTDGKERTIMRSINFVADVILITTKSYTVGNDGGTVKIDLSTNIDYTVEIPEADKAWISVAKIETRAEMRDESITLNVAANPAKTTRYSEIRLVDALGVTSETILIIQKANDDDVVYFPDANFRTYMVANFDKNKDGEISVYEASLITEIECDSYRIKSLEGIQFCTALTDLNCHDNQLTALDLSKNTALTELYCSSNQLTALDVSNSTALRGLYCGDNQLTALDVSNSTALRGLYCGDNQLTALDVSKNIALTELYCSSNQLTALDVSKNSLLKRISCEANQLTTLDVSKITALTELYCSGNPFEVLNLGDADLSIGFYEGGLGSSTELKVIGTKITSLNVSGNKLQSLDVSECPALTDLDCRSNQLTTLDVSKNTALTELSCSNNQLTTLDVSGCSALTDLSCSNNQLTTLDVSKNTALTELSCSNNQLTTLDVSGCSALTDLRCSGNPFEVLNLGGDYDSTIWFDRGGLCSSTKLKVIGTKITELHVEDNKLQSLDVSECPALTSLSCGNNQLTTLDLSNNTALTELYCYENPFEVLNLGDANISTIYFASRAEGGLGSSTKLKVIGTKITELHVANNKLQSLDVSECPALTSLSCENNQLTTLDLSKCPALTRLDCNGNPFEVLNIGDVNLGDFHFSISFDRGGLCSSTKLKVIGTKITELSVSENKLQSLDVSECPALTSLSCENNQLTTLDASGCSALTDLRCSGNPFEVLNLGDANLEGDYDSTIWLDRGGLCSSTKLKVISSKIKKLDVKENNKLQSLDISECPALTSLSCQNNQLTTLDVSNNTALRELYCHSNQLTTLDVSKTNLGEEGASLYCSENPLQTLYLKTGWLIWGINVNRNTSCIPEQTEILYKD